MPGSVMPEVRRWRREKGLIVVVLKVKGSVTGTLAKAH